VAKQTVALLKPVVTSVQAELCSDVFNTAARQPEYFKNRERFLDATGFSRDAHRPAQRV